MPDTQVTVADNFLYTRGNYELHHFSTNVLESAQAAFESALATESDSLVRVKLLNDLGNVLAALAQIRRDADLYGQSIASFEKALELVSQDTSPVGMGRDTSQFRNCIAGIGPTRGGCKIAE